MKRIFSKNGIIGCLVLINLLLISALFARDMGGIKWRDWFNKSKKARATAAAPPATGEVQEATLKMDSEIQACYDSFLSREPKVSEGAVVMHWIFNEEGQIDFLKLINSDLQDQTFLDCLSDKVRGARIPASDARAGRLISHKFKFRHAATSKLEFE